MPVFAQTQQTKGILLLILTTVLWGTSFPLLKQVLPALTPAVILAVRFTIAVIAVAPYGHPLTWKLLRDGGLLSSFTLVVIALALFVVQDQRL